MKSFVMHQPMNAIKVGDAIFETIERIEKSPFLFKECELLPSKTKKYRQALCLSWQIIYKVIDTQILILGIIHTSRKPSGTKKLIKVKY